MAEALVGLIDVLNSKQGDEKFSREEAEILNGCKSRAIKGFAVGGSIATGLVWVASRKLNSFLRVNLAGGIGFITGMWQLRESLDSCVDHILAMEGSRMQQELRRIVLQRYGNDPQRMKAFSRHFYTEEVFSDSTLNPKPVYRQRNIYMDNERVANSNTYGVPDVTKNEVYQRQRNGDPNTAKLKGSTVESRQVRINPSISTLGYGDPLEILFGSSPVYEEPRQPEESGVSTKTQSRSQRRAQRRHRLRHRHREPLSLEEA